MLLSCPGKTGTSYTGTGLAQGSGALSPHLGATCPTCGVRANVLSAQRQGAWSPLLLALERQRAAFSWTPHPPPFLLPSVNIQWYLPLARDGRRGEPPGNSRREDRIPPDDVEQLL